MEYDIVARIKAKSETDVRVAAGCVSNLVEDMAMTGRILDIGEVVFKPAQPQEKAEGQNTPTNSDYAAALRVVREWEAGHPPKLALNFFAIWCRQRINLE